MSSGRDRVARVTLAAAALITLGATLTGGPFPIEVRVSILATCAAILLYLVALEIRDGHDR
jgi:hypothetical protein